MHTLTSIRISGSSSYWKRNEGEWQRCSSELGVLGITIACESNNCKEIAVSAPSGVSWIREWIAQVKVEDVASILKLDF